MTFAAVVATLVFSVPAQAQDVAWPELAKVAETTLDQLVAGEYAPVVARFNERKTWSLMSAAGRYPALSLPSGAGPLPAIVLVHGSGQHDRDETIGPNKPFRDLAWGLASRGIAVLRYEKRTRQHQQRVAQLENGFTVKEEAIDDAGAAVALLRNRTGIRANRIYVLGHSLGAMLAPRIAAADPAVAGLVLMAGPVRSLEH
jgi:pimeloyl-ACP methyl ester carboxylesterase